ncbi:adenylate kinase [Candidatus Nitrosocosmicus franklandus]|uniref:Adenylate kinase n=1 Tax=Candidatus Nitrosocosmicus franklandianus TaxID=1798806 RepID=A0A484IGE9_9ARCH|nr:adenylate kinase [Candidatus Nitrosocosmicus franklandus]VFJ15082.1 Adenylate kinase [Candidatus Nitrosocosmicus franklandus]
MTKRVIIVGIPGVGKSTVIADVHDQLSERGIDTKMAEFGKIMFDQAKLMSINNRDQLRKLSIEQQKTLQEMTANMINSFGNDVVLIDTHLLISTDNGFYPGMPIKLLNIINPTHLILITATAQEIQSRRENDNSRQRDLFSIDRIERDLRLSESMISTSSIITGCPFYIIQNSTNQIQGATNAICKIILGK